MQIQTDIDKYKKMKKILQLLHLLTAIPLTEEKIKKIYEEEKKNLLKTRIKISKPELDAATENANSKNEKIIIDIIDPTPGLFVDDKLNLNLKNLFFTKTIK